MKTSIFILVACMAVPAFSQTRKEKQAAREEIVQKAINAGNFQIKVNYMIPAKGPGRALTTDYSLTLRNDSLISYLPYAGRAYNIPYEGGKALNFEAPVGKYQRKTRKNGDTEITVKLKNEEDSYIYRLTISKDGSAWIYIQPTQRQGISFSGKMETNEGKDR